jgi:prefoldin subunit 5
VLARAMAPDTSCIFIAVGLGFHVEVPLEEAGWLIDTRQAALREREGRCLDKAARIKAHLKFVSQAIAELLQL